ncbi:MAG TPA: acireductone synthase [candidate division Zixibacteria bacterium]|nr:acireductone synthase [candidate division Zixibacteria bacterium]
MQAVLLDIEGTTTPIDFVYKTLFPFARKHLKEYVTGKIDKVDLIQLESEFIIDPSDSKPTWKLPPLDYLNWLMDQDRKSPALKSIQGKIWKAGYENGALKGELFPDVLPSIKRWKKQEKQVAIYSSGSVLAQKLLFKYSQNGDISHLIDAYFDTEVGPKKEAESYIKIAQRINLPAGEIVFVSDNAAECQAAVEAGFEVRYSVRPGNIVEPVSFERVTSFEEI